MITTGIQPYENTDEIRTGAQHWIFFFMALLSNIWGGIVSTLMAVYLPVVVKDLLGSPSNHLNQVSAFINSLFLAGWTVGGISWGIISDRMGRVRSFILSFAAYGLFTLITGFVTTWELVVTLRLLAGFCVGGVLVISNIYLSEIWPAKTRGIFIGFLSIGFPVGIFSAGLTNLIFPGWRTGFMIGVIPLGLALLSALLLKGYKFRPETSAGERVELQKLFTHHQRDLVSGSVIFGSMLIGMWAVFSWLPTWIQSILQHSDGQKERGLSMMLMGVGGLTGGFISGWVSRGLGLKKTLLLCFAGCLVTAEILFGFNREFSDIIYAEIGVLAVFFGISQGVLSIYIPQLFSHSFRGAATGFCYNTGRLFTAAAVFFVGALVSLFNGYSHTLVVFSVIFLFGLITIYFSRDLKLKTN